MSAGPDSSVCEFLPWDTDFFGYRIGRVNGHNLTADSAGRILRWAEDQSIDCLYFLASIDDPETARLAQVHGFQLVDVRVTFELDLRKTEPHAVPAPSGVRIRGACADDVSELEAIARGSYDVSRFHFDTRFPKDKSDSLYETWIRRSCDDYADQVLVAEVEERPVGYVTLHLLEQAKGQIGLIGVGERARGKGVAKSLVYASMDWLRSRNIVLEHVVTQGRNIAAQRLYQGCGFQTASVQLWYHKWLTDPSD